MADWRKDNFICILGFLLKDSSKNKETRRQGDKETRW